MATARKLTIAIPVVSGVTAFNIQFNTDGGATWTNFDPANANPSAVVDILTSTLDANNDYTLDGLNSPAGNQVAAGAAGNWYRIRLKSSSSYGNWSHPFKIEYEPDDDGPLADAAELQDDFLDYKVALDFPTQEDADRWMGRLLNDAMRFLRMRSGFDTLYTGSRTQAQADGIRLLERRLAMVAGLKKAARMKALGMHAPLLMEESVDILAVAADLKEETDEMMEALLDVGEGDEIGSIETGNLVIPESEKSPWSQYVEDVEYWANV